MVCKMLGIHMCLTKRLKGPEKSQLVLMHVPHDTMRAMGTILRPQLAKSRPKKLRHR